MHGHFEEHLKFKDLIMRERPQTIVECGAGSGELTRKLQTLYDVYDPEIFIISDAIVDGLDSRIHFKQGISYVKLCEFPDESIDFCIIDTDHNYWTLANELSILDTKLKDSGYIAMHDVSMFYHDTGMAMSYAEDSVYPENSIRSMAFTKGGLGDALIDFLAFKRFDYKLIAFTEAHMGAAIIQKKVIKEIMIYTPGTKAPYVGANQGQGVLA